MITSTNTAIRRLNSMKIARWFMIIGCCFCILFSIMMPIWYRIETDRGCVAASNTFFPLFFTIYNLVLTIAPIFVMIIFSLLALNNLRKSRFRQVTTSKTTNLQLGTTMNRFVYHRRDIQFIKLAFIQMLIYILCTSFYGYTATFTFITQSMVKTKEQIAMDSFLNTIAINISYLYMGVSVDRC